MHKGSRVNAGTATVGAVTLLMARCGDTEADTDASVLTTQTSVPWSFAVVAPARGGGEGLVPFPRHVGGPPKTPGRSRGPVGALGFVEHFRPFATVRNH